MASVDEMEAFCRKWLNDRRGNLRLQRDLYLVTGLSDEQSNCWNASDAIAQKWGPAVFSNWHAADATQRGTPAWDSATVRVLSFPNPPYTGAPPFGSFIDFGNVVSDMIADHHALRGASLMGEYDIVGHSMGGLDTFAALFDLDSTPAAEPPRRIANAFNLATLDTPWRGVANIAIRRKFESDPQRLTQCDALAASSPQLAAVDARAAELGQRVARLTCYGADSAAQVEVSSANLFEDGTRFAAARAKTDYRFIVIPGVSHSGAFGITTSVITIANLFDTLTRGDRLSVFT